MAGRGIAPKDPAKRVRTNKPARGEWVTLPSEPFDGPKAALPRVQGGLKASTKKAWAAWWASPMAHMWSEADWPTLQELAAYTDQLADLIYKGQSNASLSREARQLRDALGLSEKGRRDLRWRLPSGEPEPELAPVEDLAKRRPDPRKQ